MLGHGEADLAGGWRGSLEAVSLPALSSGWPLAIAKRPSDWLEEEEEEKGRRKEKRKNLKNLLKNYKKF